MAKNFDVVTIGGAARDITFYTKEGRLVAQMKDPLRQKLLGFEYGAKINIEKSFQTFGGGAANAAVALARLGLKTAAIARVGKDEDGRAVITNLVKNKIDTKFIQIDPAAKTGFSFIVTFGPEVEHTAFLFRGANNNLKLAARDLKLKTDWFYVASLSGEGWRGVLDSVVAKKETRLAWNPGNTQLAAGLSGLKKYMAKTAIFFVNKDEAIQLVVSLPKYKKASTTWLNQPKNLFGVLAEFCPGILVITDGAKGAYVFFRGKIHHQISLSKKIVDTTGAGDTFCSSFLAGYINYCGDILKAAKLGAINSAYNLTGIGAQEPLLTWREAEKLMGK
ncbi:MAG: carbohydrate kinase family protein [Patescibacteria group bacterium]